MGRRQHGKGNKRGAGWHKGRATGRVARRILGRLPDTGVEVEEFGEPMPIRKANHQRRIESV